MHQARVPCQQGGGTVGVAGIYRLQQRIHRRRQRTHGGQEAARFGGRLHVAFELRPLLETVFTGENPPRFA